MKMNIPITKIIFADEEKEAIILPLYTWIIEEAFEYIITNIKAALV